MQNQIFSSFKQQLQSWLSQTRAANETPTDLVALPDVLIKQLLQHIAHLPSPPAYQTAVQKAIGDAVEVWQKNLDAPNTLVILGSPVESINKIINDSLEEWSDRPDLEITNPLVNWQRISNHLVTSQKIQQLFKPYSNIQQGIDPDLDHVLDAGCLDQRRKLVIIPSLEQCFVRSIGGWESIEFLRDLAIQNRHCFWVMGCNHWAWDFLDFVCQVSAYFSQIYPLPKLDSEMLENWLNPIIQTVVEQESSDQFPGLNKKQKNTSLEDRHQAYWQSLASQSVGVSRIAANLWVQSLRTKKEITEQKSLPSLELKKSRKDPDFTIYESRPFLPSLPSLTGQDRYLLHSVLIHGQISRTHLALSLGEGKNQIQVQVQRLLRAGILEQSQGRLAIEPIHYAKLKNELATNNFFVGED